MDNTCHSKRQLEDSNDNVPVNKLAKLENDENSFDDATEITTSFETRSQVKRKYNGSSEIDVGITEYVSNLPGFKGLIKKRYSDFVVNEIDLKGNVVRLTTMDRPPEPVLPIKLNELVDEEILHKLEELSSGNPECPEVIIKVTDMDKNTRKEVHIGIRQNYSNLESVTEGSDTEKFIRVKRKQQKGQRFIPPPGGNYTHFVLYKENRDTIHAINEIASFLRVPPKIFSYAGTKDKRAKTSQLVSAYSLRAAKLLGVNKHFKSIKTGNIEFKPDQIRLGELSGNLFTIILREFDGNSVTIENAVKSLSSKGFINYYGLQRFGTSIVPTHAIGRALLQGKWDKAIQLILAPKPEDDEDMSLAKKIWLETGDAKTALNKIKRKSSIEAKLLSGIASNNEKDFVNALSAVPRNMRLMYIHSYQSFIWNQVVSKRIHKYGLDVLKGDLILNSSNVEGNLKVSNESNKRVTLSDKVKLVSESDLQNIKITDVVIPLPGNSIVFPDNETKDWYNECLKSDGMSFHNFTSKIKSYSLSGDYRKFIILPEDVKWEILSYNDNTELLCLSDLDVLMGNTLSDLSNGGQSKALKVEFKLPSSSYATMVLREIQKIDSYWET